MVEGRVLYKGAEADVILGRWHGTQAVFKVRKPLAYRLKALDDSIRVQRTIREAQMLRDAREAGVPTPHVFFLDPKGATIVMEYVRGPRMKNEVDDHPGDSLHLFNELGKLAGKLHLAGIMHGDLTTANAVVDHPLALVDFGLSYRTTRLEDHAVDLRLVKETMTGAHPSVAKEGLASLFEGYSSVVGPARARAVLKQLRSIELRGRYARPD